MHGQVDKSAANDRFGICALCREWKKLCLSHFMPAALYPDRTGLRSQFASLLQVTGTAQEIAAYALCRACENRFNRWGETEVLRFVDPKTKGKFPLIDLIAQKIPIDVEPSSEIYSGIDLGMKMDHFAYFAMSIVWRRVAIEWNDFHGAILPRTPLAGDAEEEIRKYLCKKNAPLPKDTVVIVIVCNDDESRKVWTPPGPEEMEGCTNFRFMVRGFYFRVLIGSGMPAFYRSFCCTSPQKPFVYGSAKHRMPELMQIFNRN
jgi:hypothetical protein